MNLFSCLKFSLSILAFCFVFFLFSGTASAQTNKQLQSPSSSFGTSVNPDVEQNMHTWTQTVMIETTSALACLMTGVDAINPKQQCLGVDPKTRKIGYVSGQGGAIGQVSTMITMMYTPPLHTSDYFQHLSSNFGIVKSAYAQQPRTGIGYQGLTPLMPLWIAFRNIVYLVFVLIFIVIGMGIMLRIKIDARTVMSIENQLPKIILGILMVTFSFPIAGFIIDLMYVSIYVVAGVLGTVPGVDTGVALGNMQGITSFQFASQSLGGLMPIVNEPAAAVGAMVSSLFSGPLLSSVFGLLGGGLGWYSGTLTAAWLATSTSSGAAGSGVFLGIPLGAALVAAGTGLGGLFGALFYQTFIHILVFFVIGAAVLIALFRLWFALLFAYLYFIMDVILAPFWIIGSLLPNSPINIEGWFRDMLANLSAFPVTIAMFLMGKIFMQAFGSGAGGGLFVPPLIGNPQDLSSLSSLIGMTIILMTPGAVTMTRDILKAPTFKYTAIAGQQLQAGMKPPSRMFGGIMNSQFGTHYDSDGHGGVKMVAKTGTFANLIRSFGLGGGGGGH